jgi:hypothetical protein
MVPVWGLLAGGAVALGVGALIVEIFEESACSKRNDWQHRSDEIVRKTHAYNRDLERRFTSSSQSIAFERLSNQYYTSRKKADIVYACLREGRTELQRLNRALYLSVLDREALHQVIKNGDAAERQEAHRQLRAICDCRKRLFEERDRMVVRNENLLHEVRMLNLNTHQIKCQIRDNCGLGGRLWYQRREARVNRS